MKTMRTIDRVMVPNSTCIGIKKPSVYAVAGLQLAPAESQPLRFPHGNLTPIGPTQMHYKPLSSQEE